MSAKIPGWESVSIINRHHVNITPIVSLSLSLSLARAGQSVVKIRPIDLFGHGKLDVDTLGISE